MDDQCKCHLLKEKCKSYNHQPASEIICQACLNQPIITVVTRQFQVSRGNSPATEAAVPAAGSSSSCTPEVLISSVVTRLQQQQQQQQQMPLVPSQLSHDTGKSSSRPIVVPSDGRNNDFSARSPRQLRSSQGTTTATHSTQSSTPSTKASFIDKRTITTDKKKSVEVGTGFQSSLTTNARQLVGEASEGGVGRLSSAEEVRAINRGSRCVTTAIASPVAATKLTLSVSTGSYDSTTTSWVTTAQASADSLRQAAARNKRPDTRLSNNSSDCDDSSLSDVSDENSTDSSHTSSDKHAAAARKFHPLSAAPRSVWRHRRRRRLPRRHWDRHPTATMTTRTARHRKRDDDGRRTGRCSGATSPTNRQHQRGHVPLHNSSAISTESLTSVEAAALVHGASGQMRGNRTDQSAESQTPECILRDLMSSGKLGDAMGAHRTPRSSENRLSKPEPLSLVEKAITDFFTTHKGDSAPRVVPTQGDGKWPGGGDKSGGPFHQDPHQTAAQISAGHLLKDSIIIGNQSVFEQFASREFILPMFDSMLNAFLNDSSTLRAACSQTRCRVELSRRILNRRVLHGSWVKYMVVTISGSTLGAIDNCDRLLKKYLQAYRLRRVHDKETSCCLFLREDIPDNASLCFSHQRTGVATTRYGNLKLQSTFSSVRKGGGCGKQGLTKYGRAALSSRRSKQCIKFVYSNAFQSSTSCVPNYCTGVAAIDKLQSMQDDAVDTRHAALEQRKKMVLPLFRV